MKFHCEQFTSLNYSNMPRRSSTVTVTEPDAPARPSTSSSSSTSSGLHSEAEVQCMKCHDKMAIYETDPCHHLCFCKTCAMKCASGGKCKICNQMYGGLRRAS